MPVPEDRRYDLVDARITLNGEKAALTGIKNRFATVTQYGTGLSCEFSWETAEHIITKKNGDFRSH